MSQYKMIIGLSLMASMLSACGQAVRAPAEEQAAAEVHSKLLADQKRASAALERAGVATSLDAAEEAALETGISCVTDAVGASDQARSALFKNLIGELQAISGDAQSQETANLGANVQDFQTQITGQMDALVGELQECVKDLPNSGQIEVGEDAAPQLPEFPEGFQLPEGVDFRSLLANSVK